MGVMKLKVDATVGVRVGVGERVEKGTTIGEMEGETVVSDGAGIVESIEFDGTRHEFEVIIRGE